MLSRLPYSKEDSKDDEIPNSSLSWGRRKKSATNLWELLKSFGLKRGREREHPISGWEQLRIAHLWQVVCAYCNMRDVYAASRLFSIANWSCFVVSAICFLDAGPQLWKSRSFPSRNGRRMLKSVWVAFATPILWYTRACILCLDPGLQGLCFAGPAMSEHWKVKAVDESCVSYQSSAGNAFHRRTWKWADWGFQGAKQERFRLRMMPRCQQSPMKEMHTEAFAESLAIGI